MFIYDIERDNEQVVIKLDSDLGTCSPVYPFYYNCGDQEHAELLTRHLTKEWQKYQEAIVKEAYIFGQPEDISALKKWLIEHWDGRNHCRKWGAP